MPPNKKSRQLNLLKRSIEVKQQTLQFRLKQMNLSLDKIEQTIEKFSQYIQNYEERLYSQQPKSSGHFINYQAFLDQLSNTLHRETDEQKNILSKKESLLEELKQNSHQIDVIENALHRFHQENNQQKNKLIEQIELDQWLAHSNDKSDQFS